MEGDRKYRQHGYNDSDRERGSGPRQEDRPRPQGPRPPIDVTGPRLPRLVQAVTASRCYNCAVTLPADMDFRGNCPKCNAALHCCKQCAFFEPSTRFQCTKPILARISPKDQANECALFKARLTVARDAPTTAPTQQSVPAANVQVPKNADDARAAFDNLFKKL
ncbi:MAG: hypothetical protein ABL967_05780 [Bryobacteraceae bacterium]